MRSIFCSVGFLLTILLPLNALAADFSGQWRSDFGLVDLQQQQSSVKGSYACCNGILEGQVVGNQLDFEWEDPVYGSGWGRFTLSPDGKSFDGIWGYSGSMEPNGNWNGSRIVEAVYRGEESSWVVVGESGSGSLEGLAKLYTEGNRVTGWLKGVYTFPLEVEGASNEPATFEVVNELEGRTDEDQMYLKWTNPLQGSAGTMELVIRAPNRHMEGTWQADDGSTGTIVMSVTDGDVEPGSERSQSTEQPPTLDLEKMAKTSHDTIRAEQLLRDAANLVDAGQYQQAHEIFRKAEAVFRAAGNQNKLGYALYGMSDTEERRGRYEDARQRYVEVLELGSAVDESIRLLAEQRLWIINNVILGLSSGESGQAAAPSPIMDESLPESMRLKEAAQAQVSASNYAEALPLISQSLAAYRLEEIAARGSIAETGIQISIANLLHDAARAHFFIDQIDQAIESLREALVVWRKVGDEQGETWKQPSAQNIAGTLGLIGTFELRRGRSDLAIGSFEEAVAIRQRLGAPDTWQVQHGLARAYDAAARFDEAEDGYWAAIDQIESLRAGLVTDETKIGFLRWRADPYEDLVDFLMKQGGEERALQALDVAERARARALLDSLATPDGKASAIASPRQAFGEIANPGLAQTLTAEEIAHRIRGGETTYISYFTTETAVHAWIITHSGDVKASTLPTSRSDLNRMVRKLREDLRAEFDDRTASQALYKALLMPLEPDLGSASDGALTILPHGPLHMVSFAALREPDDRYFGERYSLSTVPSFSFLPHLKQPSSTPESRLLAIGKPAGSQGLDLSETEVHSVSKLFDEGQSTILLGEAATREAVVETLPNHEIVLFSTHGKQDQDDEEAFYLELAHGQRLARSDIQTLPLDGIELVVLSACDTHTGRLHAGDELMSLARAFLAAGAKSALVTLWPVEEVATVTIVVDTLSRLKQGQPLGQALHQAQRKYLETIDKPQRSRPFYWAPWLVVGTAT